MNDNNTPRQAGFFKKYFEQLKKELTEGPPHVLAICHVGLIACPIMLFFAISMTFSPGADRVITEIRGTALLEHMRFIEVGVKHLAQKTGSLPGNIKAFYHVETFAQPFNNTANAVAAGQTPADLQIINFPVNDGTTVQANPAAAGEVRHGLEVSELEQPILYTENLDGFSRGKEGFLYLGDGGVYYFLGPFAARDDLLHVLYNKCNHNVPEVAIDVTATSALSDGKIYSGQDKPAGKCILTGAETTINPESELSVTKNDSLAYVNPEFITQGKPEDENYYLGYRIMDRVELKIPSVSS